MLTTEGVTRIIIELRQRAEGINDRIGRVDASDIEALRDLIADVERLSADAWSVRRLGSMAYLADEATKIIAEASGFYDSLVGILAREKISGDESLKTLMTALQRAIRGSPRTPPVPASPTSSAYSWDADTSTDPIGSYDDASSIASDDSNASSGGISLRGEVMIDLPWLADFARSAESGGWVRSAASGGVSVAGKDTFLTYSKESDPTQFWIDTIRNVANGSLQLPQAVRNELFEYVNTEEEITYVLKDGKSEEGYKDRVSEIDSSDSVAVRELHKEFYEAKTETKHGYALKQDATEEKLYGSLKKAGFSDETIELLKTRYFQNLAAFMRRLLQEKVMAATQASCSVSDSENVAKVEIGEDGSLYLDVTENDFVVKGMKKDRAAIAAGFSGEVSMRFHLCAQGWQVVDLQTSGEVLQLIGGKDVIPLLINKGVVESPLGGVEEGIRRSVENEVVRIEGLASTEGGIHTVEDYLMRIREYSLSGGKSVNGTGNRRNNAAAVAIELLVNGFTTAEGRTFRFDDDDVKKVYNDDRESKYAIDWISLAKRGYKDDETYYGMPAVSRFQRAGHAIAIKNFSDDIYAAAARAVSSGKKRSELGRYALQALRALVWFAPSDVLIKSFNLRLENNSFSSEEKARKLGVEVSKMVRDPKEKKDNISLELAQDAGRIMTRYHRGECSLSEPIRRWWGVFYGAMLTAILTGKDVIVIKKDGEKSGMLERAAACLGTDLQTMLSWSTPIEQDALLVRVASSVPPAENFHRLQAVVLAIWGITSALHLSEKALEVQQQRLQPYWWKLACYADNIGKAYSFLDTALKGKSVPIDQISSMSNEQLGKLFKHMQDSSVLSGAVYDFCFSIIQSRLSACVSSVERFNEICQVLQVSARQAVGILEPKSLGGLLCTVVNNIPPDYAILEALLEVKEKLAVVSNGAANLIKAQQLLETYSAGLVMSAQGFALKEPKKAYELLMHEDLLVRSEVVIEALRKITAAEWVSIIYHVLPKDVSSLTADTTDARSIYELCRRFSSLPTFSSSFYLLGAISVENLFRGEPEQATFKAWVRTEGGGHLSTVTMGNHDESMRLKVVEDLAKFIGVSNVARVIRVVGDMFDGLISCSVKDFLCARTMPRLSSSWDKVIELIQERINYERSQAAESASDGRTFGVTPGNVSPKKGGQRVNYSGTGVLEQLQVMELHSVVCDPATVGAWNLEQYEKEIAKVKYPTRLIFIRQLLEFAQDASYSNFKVQVETIVSQYVLNHLADPAMEKDLVAASPTLFRSAFAATLLNGYLATSEKVQKEFGHLVLAWGREAVASRVPVVFAYSNELLVYKACVEFVGSSEFRNESARKSFLDCILSVSSDSNSHTLTLRTGLCLTILGAGNVNLLDREQLGALFRGISVGALPEGKLGESIANLVKQYGKLDFSTIVVPAVAESVIVTSSSLDSLKMVDNIVKETELSAILKCAEPNKTIFLGRKLNLMAGESGFDDKVKAMFIGGEIGSAGEFFRVYCGVEQYVNAENRSKVLAAGWKVVTSVEDRKVVIDPILRPAESHPGMPRTLSSSTLCGLALSDDELVTGCSFVEGSLLIPADRGITGYTLNELGKLWQNYIPRSAAEKVPFPSAPESKMKVAIAGIFFGNPASAACSLRTMLVSSTAMEGFYNGLLDNLLKYNAPIISPECICNAFAGIRDGGFAADNLKVYRLLNLPTEEGFPAGQVGFTLTSNFFSRNSATLYWRDSQNALQSANIDGGDDVKRLFGLQKRVVNLQQQVDKEERKGDKGKPAVLGKARGDLGDAQRQLRARVLSLSMQKGGPGPVSRSLVQTGMANVVLERELLRESCAGCFATFSDLGSKKIHPADAQGQLENLFRMCREIGCVLEKNGTDSVPKLSKFGRELLHSRAFYAVFSQGYSCKLMSTSQDKLNGLEVGFYSDKEKIYCKIEGKEPLLVEDGPLIAMLTPKFRKKTVTFTGEERTQVLKFTSNKGYTSQEADRNLKEKVIKSAAAALKKAGEWFFVETRVRFHASRAAKQALKHCAELVQKASCPAQELRRFPPSTDAALRGVLGVGNGAVGVGVGGHPANPEMPAAAAEDPSEHVAGPSRVSSH